MGVSERRRKPPIWAYVSLGGGVGALLRFVIDTLWAGNSGLAVLLINVIGSFALGYLVTTLFARPGQAGWLAPALGPGLLGGFTTMSGFALWVNQTAMASGPFVTAGYFLASLVLGLAAAWGGLLLGRHQGARPLPRLTDERMVDES